MNRVSVLTACLGFWIVPLALSALDPPAESQVELYYATTRGSKWVYRESEKTFTVILTAVERQNQRTLVTLESWAPEGKSEPKEKLALSAAGIFRIAALGKSFDPPFCLLKLPTNENRQWETKIGNGDFQIKTKHTAFGPDEVKVPAGRYKCIRVESEDIISGGIDDHRNRQTDWYAPGVGLIKSVFNGSQTELIEFSPGKD